MQPSFQFKQREPNRKPFVPQFYALFHVGYISHIALLNSKPNIVPDNVGYVILKSEKSFPKHVSAVSDFMFEHRKDTGLVITKSHEHGGCSIPAYSILPVLEKLRTQIVDYALLMDLYKKKKVNEKAICKRNTGKVKIVGAQFDRSILNMEEFEEYMFHKSSTIATLNLLVDEKVVKLPQNQVRFPNGYRDSQPDFEGKGEFGKRCNVNACQLENSAFFYNKNMRHQYHTYYCLECANQIQQAAKQYDEDLPFDDDVLHEAFANQTYTITGSENL